MKKINNITIGADPEVFLFNIKDKEFVSAEGIIGGTKYEPIKISPKGHAIQEDNVMAEFNIPPSTTPKEIFNHIRFVLTYIRFLLPKNVRIAIKPSATFDSKYLQTDQAKLFGCDPDYDAWNMCVNQPPRADNGNLRTGGGHIHVGYDNPEQELSLEIIRAMDVFIGVPSIFIDKDNDRRKMYGKAGCFRFKEYGLEYRTLSNFWIKKYPYIKWMVDSLNKAVEFINDGNIVSMEDKDSVIKIINTGDVDLAKEIMKKYKIETPSKRMEKRKLVFA